MKFILELVFKEARQALTVEKKEKPVEKPLHGALLKVVPGCARKYNNAPEEINSKSR